MVLSERRACVRRQPGDLCDVRSWKSGGHEGEENRPNGLEMRMRPMATRDSVT